MRVRNTGTFLAAILCMCAVCIAAVVICPKCGYENAGENAVCVHCNAGLPAQKPIEKPSAETKPVSPGKISLATVEEEIKAGMEQMQVRDLPVAWLFFKNAWALDLVASNHEKSKFSDRIANLIKATDYTGTKGQVACPACNGAGKVMTPVFDLSGKVSQMKPRTCPRCQGATLLPCAPTTAERTQTLGQAKGRYMKLQQARRCLPIGNAWIPPEVEPALGVREIATLRRTTASGCAACAGGGTVDCQKCRRLGEIKCPNDKCKGGREEVVANNLIVSTKVLRTEQCKMCEGKATIVCQQCSGTGGTVCKVCGGTGERPLCSKCGGRGFTVCAKCNGKGGDCTACRGGAIPCVQCSGDGKEK